MGNRLFLCCCCMLLTRGARKVYICLIMESLEGICRAPCHFCFLCFSFVSMLVFTTILQNAKQELSERAQIHSLGRLLSRSILPSLGRKRLFVFPLTNAQLDLTKRKMSLNGSANVKHSEAMSDEIITAMSTACGANIFLFELFKKKNRKHLLSQLRNERGLLGFNNMMHAMHEYQAK